MKKNLIISLIILAVVVAAATTFIFLQHSNILENVGMSVSPPTIQDKQIVNNTKPLNIKINYPYVDGLDDFNQKAKAIIDKEFDSFKNQLFSQ